jgi:hypothetical protein
MRQISPTVSRQNGCEIVGDFSVDRVVDKTVAPRGVFGFRAEIVSRSELSSREP